MRIGNLSFTREDANNGVKGHYGKVFNGHYDNIVVVTVIKIDVNEIHVNKKILRQTDMHPNIVRFYGEEMSDNDLIAYQ